MRISTRFTGILLGAALFAGLSASPSLAVGLNYSTSGTGPFGSLGNQWTPASPYDIVNLLPVTGVLSGNGSYLLNTVKFDVGYNASVPGSASGPPLPSWSENITIGNVTAPLSIPWEILINYTDTLKLGSASISLAGWTVSFAQTTFGPQGNGLQTYDLWATFTQTVGGPPSETPLPGAIVLFGSALVGASLIVRRRRTVKAV